MYMYICIYLYIYKYCAHPISIPPSLYINNFLWILAKVHRKSNPPQTLCKYRNVFQKTQGPRDHIHRHVCM